MGNVQVGKSTILNRTLERIKASKPEIVFGGFRSLKQGMTIYMFGANEKFEDCGEENIVCIRRGPLNMYDARPDTFNLLGKKYFSEPKNPGIIIMDELGYMESEAYEFQELVFNALDGNIPVIGVVKPRETPFLSRVRAHKDIELIDVQIENREACIEPAFAWADML